MKDQYQRKIEYLRISITDRCNFRCSYCMPKDGVQVVSHQEILTFEELLRFCKIMTGLGITRIKITGGEPLVRKGAVSFIEQLTHMDGIEEVTMTTNGALLRPYLKELKEAGLHGINISLDTLEEEKFQRITGQNQLPEVLEAIREAVRVGIPSVKINCIPMRGVNEEELCEIARLAKELPIAVRFIEMMPIGMGKQYEGVAEAEIHNCLEQKFGPLSVMNKKIGNGPASYYTLDGFCGCIGFISALSHKFCGTCNRVRLTPEGVLKTCLQFAGSTDVRAMLRDGRTEKELVEAIRNAIYQKPGCHQFDAAAGEQWMEKEQGMMTGIGG